MPQLKLSGIIFSRIVEIRRRGGQCAATDAPNGGRLATEAHFVHARDNGDLLVVGSFLVAGAPNKAFSAVMAAARRRRARPR